MKHSTLLLAAHGSSLDPASAAPVHEHAARIRALRLFAAVRVAFWKEPPYLHAACADVAGPVVAVPMFMAEGYFTREVLPRELRRAAADITLCPPVGAHPRIGELVSLRAAEVDIVQRSATLVLVGHGTPRSPTSADTAWRVTRQLRRTGRFGAVQCGFIDQEPRIERVLDRVASPHCIIVPFFLADGYHTRATIPELLGLGGACTVRGERRLWYTRAVGTLPALAPLIVELARSTHPPSPG